MIVIKNVFGGSKVYIKNVFAGAENLVVVYNGGEPIEVTGSGGGGGVTDHGALTGLADDDHTQYLNELRGDARYEPLKGTDDNYVTDAEKVILSNTSGTNTGDQDLSGKQDLLVSATNIKTVNGSSILGSGDLVVSGGLSTTTDILMQNALGNPIKAQTFDILNASAATTRAGADNRIDYYAIYIPVATTITGVEWLQATQGNYTGDNYNGWGLFSYSSGTLTLVASTTNDPDIWKGGAFTGQTKAFSSPYSAAAGVYYIAWIYCQSAQTTAPVIFAKLVYPVGTANLFLNSAAITLFQSGQTALPASVETTSLSLITSYAWVGLY